MQPTAEPGSPYRRHVASLDGLRGLAILGVMAAHLFVMQPQSHAGLWVQKTLGFGGVGVVLFFVLSGFLITGILFDSLGSATFFRTFYLRRVLRIAPLYYVVLLGFAIAAVFGARYSGELGSLALYLQNTNLIAPAIWYYAGPSPLPLMHFWTLAVEEQFYLVWPLLVFALKTRRDVLWTCLGGAAFSVLLRFWLLLHGVDDAMIHGMTICRLDTLLLGGAVAMLLREETNVPWLKLFAWPLGLGVVLAVLSAHTAQWTANLALLAAANSASYLAYALLCVGLLLWSLGDGRRLFSMPWLQTIGRYSYGLYVFHYMLNGFWNAPLRAWLSGRGLRSPWLVVLLAGAVIAGASAACAWLSFQLLERRFLALKRLVPYERANA